MRSPAAREAPHHEIGSKGRAAPCRWRARAMPQAVNSIDQLLEQLVENKASDLHISVGAPPSIRVRGEIRRLEEYDLLDGEVTRQLLYRILSSEQQKNFEIKRQLDFAYGIP